MSNEIRVETRLDAESYEALAALARENDRSIAAELRQIVKTATRKAGKR